MEILKIKLKNILVGLRFFYRKKFRLSFLSPFLSPIFIVNNQTQFTKIFSDRKFIESVLSKDKNLFSEPIFKVDGFCIPCNKKVKFLVDLTSGGKKKRNKYIPNLRERLECPLCKMNNRQRLVTTIIEQLLINAKIQNIYFMEQVTPIFIYFKNLLNNRNIIGSEYFGDRFKSGKIYSGVRHEDVEKLSFNNNSIDLIVSNDVFEHVPNPKIAFKESFRVLRKNGIMIFTIPFHSNKSKSVTRAKFSDNTLNFVLPKIFHGNPVSKDGSLVFTDFGWDVLSLVKNAGFAAVNVEGYLSLEYGHFGNVQIVFRAIK